MSEYLGISSDGWSFVFGAVQTGAVVFGVGFGAVQLRDIARQRAQSSLEVMLEEWRRSYKDRDLVIDAFPFHPGGVPERAVHLTQAICSVTSGDRELKEVLDAARRVVHELNDLGGFLERGSVSERDFFGHFHVRIIELVFLLEPYILVATVCRGTRWGIRLRRMQTGAVKYHRQNTVHRQRAIVMRGQIVVEASAGRSLFDRFWKLRRLRLVPTKQAALAGDDAAIAAVRTALEQAEVDTGDLAKRLASFS